MDQISHAHTPANLVYQAVRIIVTIMGDDLLARLCTMNFAGSFECLIYFFTVHQLACFPCSVKQAKSLFCHLHAFPFQRRR